MKHLEATFDVSERRACRAIDQPRSTQLYPTRECKEETRLVRRRLQLSRQHPRYGYRRVTALLKEGGWRVKRKRVHRLWRREGLKVPVRQRMRRAVGWNPTNGSCRRADHKDHFWSYDFLFGLYSPNVDLPPTVRYLGDSVQGASRPRKG